MTSLNLSIITSVYSYDRRRYLRSFLEGIANQTAKDFETIVVVDGCARLSRYAHNLVKQLDLPRCRILFVRQRSGASASKNWGIKNVRGQIVGFLDDDTVPSRDWAQNVVESFSKIPEMVGLMGPSYPIFENPRDAWFPEPLQWLVACSGWRENRLHELRSVWTVNAAFRRDDVLAVGGFSPDLGPSNGKAGFWGLAEDLDFSLRVRYRTKKRIFYVPNAFVYHYVSHSRVNLPYVMRRALFVGKERRLLKSCGIRLNSRSQEYSLIHKIAISFMPKYARSLFHDPRVAARQMMFLAAALLFTLLGFLGANGRLPDAPFMSLRKH